MPVVTMTNMNELVSMKADTAVNVIGVPMDLDSSSVPSSNGTGQVHLLKMKVADTHGSVRCMLILTDRCERHVLKSYCRQVDATLWGDLASNVEQKLASKPKQVVLLKRFRTKSFQERMSIASVQNSRVEFPTTGPEATKIAAW